MIRIFARLPRVGGAFAGQFVALGCATAAVLARVAAEAFWPGLHGLALLFPAIALAGVIAGRPAGLSCVLLLGMATLGGNLTGSSVLAAWEVLLLLIAGGAVGLMAGELRQALDQARRLERRLDRVQRLAPAGDWRWNRTAQTLRLSASAWRLLGRPPEARPVSLGHLHTYIHPDDLDAFRQSARNLETEGFEASFRVLSAGEGDTRVLLMRGGSEPRGGAGGVLMDITEQHRAEGECRAAIARYDRLYRELTHRVKNNFQLVASLLRLQGRRAMPEVRGALEMAGQRIQSMAALHEALYRGGDLGTVSFDRYLEDFCQWIVRHWMTRRPITLRVEAEPVAVNGDRALPLGLAVAEMVDNALRHAYPEGRQGTIRVLFRREGEMLVLAVEDDGQGMDALDAMRSAGFGMTMLQSSARQVEGELLTEHRPRTRFTIRFPEVAPD